MTAPTLYDVYVHIRSTVKNKIKEKYNILNEDHYILYICTRLIASIDNSLWIYDEDIMKAYYDEDKEEVIILAKLDIILYAYLLAQHYDIHSYEISYPSPNQINEIYTLDICGIVLNSLLNKNNSNTKQFIIKYLTNLIHDVQLDEKSIDLASKLNKHVQEKVY